MFSQSKDGRGLRAAGVLSAVTGGMIAESVMGLPEGNNPLTELACTQVDMPSCQTRSVGLSCPEAASCLSWVAVAGAAAC